MREAWEPKWQTVDADGAAVQKTFVEAAARLGVGIVASAPLQEGILLQDADLQVAASLFLPFSLVQFWCVGLIQMTSEAFVQILLCFHHLFIPFDHEGDMHA
jgi:hypothetical protein